MFGRFNGAQRFYATISNVQDYFVFVVVPVVLDQTIPL